MNMKWVGCRNHNLQLDPSEKPSESPTTDSTSLPEQITDDGAFLLPQPLLIIKAKI
jgi:hypothetical protein